MANYCPTCGFPHNHKKTDVIPHSIGVRDLGESYDSVELICQVCGDVAERWMWEDDRLDGDFDWVDAETGAWLLN